MRWPPPPGGEGGPAPPLISAVPALPPRPCHVACSFLTFYEANGLLARLDPAAVAQCQNVFLLDEAAAALRDGRADQALRLWEASGYLPFGAQSSIEACLERLQTLPPRVLPDLLVLAETAVHRLYQTLLGSAPDPGRQQVRCRNAPHGRVRSVGSAPGRISAVPRVDGWTGNGPAAAGVAAADRADGPAAAAATGGDVQPALPNGRLHELEGARAIV